MTTALPTHLVDSVTSATATGVEAAGHLLHEVSDAVGHAIDTTGTRARKIIRQARPGATRRRRISRATVFVGVFAGAVVLVLAVRRSLLGRGVQASAGVKDDAPESSETASKTADAAMAAPKADAAEKANGRFEAVRHQAS